MPRTTLDEREFELINIIGAQISCNQRDLSRRMDMSLGMTNMLIKRLIAKGYIRIRQLNRKKVEYLLTPKGFAEKMRKSVKYTLNTIQRIGLIKQGLKDILLKYYGQGERFFVILGRSDFALLVEMVLKDISVPDIEITYIDQIQDWSQKGVLFICREGYERIASNGKRVNLISELAKSADFSIYAKELTRDTVDMNQKERTDL